ncbi:MAG TPA: hypothetical protein VMF50_17980 [Candidatus Binataceae bacterium]|nr:hypothetical protein [Candidatus Binataceae bacterium]
MKNLRHWLYGLLALTGGILGGAIASRVAAPEGLALAATHGMSMREIRAQKFVLVGSDGTERGLIRVTSRGMSDIELDDANGRDRAEFRVAGDGGASVTFYDEQGSRRVQLESTPQGRDGLALFAAGGRQLATFSVAEDNQTSVTLYDPNNGVARVGLGVAANGEPALALFDAKGHDRAELHVNSSGKPGLALADESGKTIAGLPMEESGQLQQAQPQ